VEFAAMVVETPATEPPFKEVSRPEIIIGAVTWTKKRRTHPTRPPREGATTDLPHSPLDRLRRSCYYRIRIARHDLRGCSRANALCPRCLRSGLGSKRLIAPEYGPEFSHVFI
jgi:hypothetical protein